MTLWRNSFFLCCFLLFSQTLKGQSLYDDEFPIKERDLRAIFQSPILFSDNSLYQNSKTRIFSNFSSGNSNFVSSGGKNFELVEYQDSYGITFESRPTESLSVVLSPSTAIQNVAPLSGGQAAIFPFGSLSPMIGNLMSTNSASMSWNLDQFSAKGWINQTSTFNNWQTYEFMTEGTGMDFSYHAKTLTTFSISVANNFNQYGMMIPNWSYLYNQSDSLLAVRMEQPIKNTPLTFWTESSIDKNTAMSGFENLNYYYGWSISSVKSGLNWSVDRNSLFSIGASSSELLYTQGYGSENFKDIFGEWKQKVSSKAALNLGTDFQDCNYTAGSQSLLDTDQGSRLFLSIGPQVQLSKDFSARLDMKYRLGDPNLKYEALQIPERYFLFSVQGKF
ncbi:hypothetical protein A7K73_10085 [Candidatus Methylacidiphilum fumarolicum]|uniref:Uncharacterized protein n=2 Tax=Candidatus Methylacidiphilum fumarolicum TaxID=591154 RepID=I0JW75_METFB|nr:hypothetical protein [Candidatus Methylacidiphilum fumarolicum]TFE66738.1 hypothetical protein A7K73_10085 [Candidatus Methylacidiphilum fumarolicum]TFE76865.1 hypothetical protein A7D33_07780 [Candidatus Methylacidiphilum fumarolicum]CAI9085978.1 conserved protein of unknown function [Candidatus Methylacidiphilum fumarolicum]CCG91494.1 conserved exported hypothetical protein [Methylacidiphilum fumariolicum SolV]